MLQHWRHVVVFPRTADEPASTVLHMLQMLQHCLRKDVEQRIRVVEACSNTHVYQGFARIISDAWPDLSNVAYLVIARLLSEQQHYWILHIKTLERIQRQAARFCTQNSRDPGTVTQLLKDLQWDTLQTRRKIKRLSIIYKMEHNLIDIPLDHYIQNNTRSSRKHNSQFLQIRYSANIFGNSFFPTTIKEWNSLSPNIVSSKSINSFQNNLIQHFNN